jgi:hypothetical protein
VIARGALALSLAVSLASGSASTGAKTPPPAEADAATHETAPASPSFHQLDVVPRTIEPELMDALEYPYRKPVPGDCAGLAAEIAKLDAILGPDFDAAEPSGDESHFAADLLLGGLRSAIPYFGWVRRLTGVDRRERQAVLARAAGDTRRGYLKGLGEAQKCQPPAAPSPPPKPAAEARKADSD